MNSKSKKNTGLRLYRVCLVIVVVVFFKGGGGFSRYWSYPLYKDVPLAPRLAPPVNAYAELSGHRRTKAVQ